MLSEPVLLVEKLNLYSHSRTLFKNISFNLYQGEVAAIMGPSGIGKSMLIKAIAGFLPSSIKVQGRIEKNGAEISQLSMLERSPAQCPSVIFQDALKSLNPLATLAQQLSLALTKNTSRLSTENKNLVLALLSQLGFSEPEFILAALPSQLSGGQRQRICIAIALLGNTDLIIADEPTSALDPVTGSEILSLFFQNIKQRNICGLLITHDLLSAITCDKLLLIADDSNVTFGAPYDAIYQNKHAFSQSLIQLLP